jgi:UDP-glucose 4-epimerase
MKILITGGAGYIGSHCCKLLAKAGHELIVYDNLYRGHTEFTKWGTCVCGDMNNLSLLAWTILRHEPEAVFHFAALAYVGESVRKPLAYYDNNICGTISLLQAIRNTSVKYLIFSSSCSVYGMPEVNVPIKETAPLAPITPYGFSKFAAESIIQNTAKITGLKYTLLRYFNAAGADPDGEIGEMHVPETHVIPNILSAALSDTPAFEVYGLDYDTKDGTCVRDYVHVNDIASAHIKSLEYLSAGGSSDIFNIGYGEGYSILDLCEVVKGICGRFPIVYKEKRPGDPPSLIADPKKIYEKLCWKPTFDDIELIVETAWRWHTSNNYKRMAHHG